MCHWYMKIFFLHFFNSCIPVSHDNTFTIEKKRITTFNINFHLFCIWKTKKVFLSQKIRKNLYISSAILKHYRREYRQCGISKRYLHFFTPEQLSFIKYLKIYSYLNLSS